jgi:transposase
MEPNRQQKRARKRRRFTDEFKASAVRLVLEEGQSISAVARDLDVIPSALGNWVKQAKADRGSGSPTVMTSSEKEELGRLRRENRMLRMEREILKKAAAFFAKENT